MERKRYFIIVALVMLHIITFGQYKEAIYMSFTGDDMSPWKEVVDSMEKEGQKTPKQRLELVNYAYGYIGWCIGKERYDEAREYMERAGNHMDMLEDLHYELSSVYAYRAAYTGFRIALAPYKAPFLGPKSIEYARKAVNLNPENYLAILQQANIKYYTPALFGGSKTEAIELYKKSLRKYIAAYDTPANDWNYLSLYITLITTTYETEDFKAAEKYCLQALSIEPEFHWVKNELYPKIIKSLKNE